MNANHIIEILRQIKAKYKERMKKHKVKTTYFVPISYHDYIILQEAILMIKRKEKNVMDEKKEIDKLCKDCKHYSKADFLECSITKDINGNLFCPYKEKVEQKEIKVRYKFYFSAIQCNRTYSNFIRNCDLGVSDVGSQVEISFTTDKKPTQKNIDKMINILESTKQEESLAQYYTCVKYVRTEII